MQRDISVAGNSSLNRNHFQPQALSVIKFPPSSLHPILRPRPAPPPRRIAMIVQRTLALSLRRVATPRVASFAARRTFVGSVRRSEEKSGVSKQYKAFNGMDT